ncbi:hypothetical protein LS684_08660 [Cytobacillus spongiae]|uniref:hypothetical protein n=1 Tax=Cytobacillus spongiae TaxID=2901381 RepID=UPI001F303CD7|nr:hypothetical protein [Cytobacillus spongiae]UII57489.1 hypothetical protein LS684_08660 [Cytobacillus spongiae]
MKQIRGSQLNPNNVSLECIRVPKVYDWVFDAISTDDSVNVPADCAANIAAAVADGRTPLNVTCEAPPVGGFFPLNPIPDPSGNVSCVVSAIIDREGLPEGLGVVKVILTVRPLITVFDNTGLPICQFRPTFSTSRRLVACVPELLTNDNATCRIISLTCDTNFNETGVPDLGLQIALDICFDVQFEAEVKLEVEGKFCFPRENDIELPPGGSCPTFEYPQQCPTIFPEANCTCQGFADSVEEDQTNGTFAGVTTNTTPPILAGPIGVPNVQTLMATICNNCNLDGSTMSYSIEDNRAIIPPGGLRYSFTFTADEINYPTCTFNTTTSLLTVTGSGRWNFVNPLIPDRDATFSLILSDGATDSYTLTLNDGQGGTYITTVTTADEDIEVQDCITFDEV